MCDSSQIKLSTGKDFVGAVTREAKPTPRANILPLTPTPQRSDMDAGLTITVHINREMDMNIFFGIVASEPSSGAGKDPWCCGILSESDSRNGEMSGSYGREVEHSDGSVVIFDRAFEFKVVVGNMQCIIRPVGIFFDEKRIDPGVDSSVANSIGGCKEDELRMEALRAELDRLNRQVAATKAVRTALRNGDGMDHSK